MHLFKYAFLAMTVSTGFAQTDPSIPLQIRMPDVQMPMRNPIEMRSKVEEIRALQLQNEQIRLQNEATRASQAAPALPSFPPPVAPLSPSTSTDLGEMKTHGLLNCRAWKGSSEGLRTVYIAAGIEMLSEVVSDAVKDEDKRRQLMDNYMPYDLSLDEMATGTSQLCNQPETH